ncbi:PREDICTED: uncharacterized protein LOC109127155 [Camelina sativa]|uniref:Uncharacterized protein LOC109127155 n=1 Tax=Camelina sativa TaxID=90675 RepID=A0ABM1QJS6_CAMSA|nr:PREDICTED: uncharacterized protein LOC109127155 [Camelina sativa]
MGDGSSTRSNSSNSSSEKPEWLQQYSLVGKIGEGTYGLVFLARTKTPPKRPIAIKKFKQSKDGDGVSPTAIREARSYMTLYLAFDYAEYDLYEIIRHHRDKVSPRSYSVKFLASIGGSAAHTDLGAITLLIPNEVPGLQVFKNEQWFDVEYINSAMVVFIGDQLMRMTNGRFKNVLHRAKSDKERLRISWPVFVSPKHDLLVGPLPELTGDESPPKFETLVYQDYLHQTMQNWALDKLYNKESTDLLKTH